MEFCGKVAQESRVNPLDSLVSQIEFFIFTFQQETVLPLFDGVLRMLWPDLVVTALRPKVLDSGCQGDGVL